jgi:anti-sigma regulatory factor (Ser/Thr protein kinase)
MSEASVELPALASSARAARQFVRQTLLEWNLPGIVESATLITSELVTNAVLHARPDARADDAIELRVCAIARGVRVEVDDASDLVPVQRRATDNGGRGLNIVDTMSTAWGTDPKPGGKTVWFELDEP